MAMIANLFALALVAGQLAVVKAQGQALTEPTVISSSNGVLDITLTIAYGTISGPFYTLTNTRLFNGIYPGPTIKINPGDTVRILFQNNLSLQSGSVQSGTNVFLKPDTSNIHFHGGHVSGELPSDDVRLEVTPQSNYQYETVFPSNHMPGTHWIHPHHHGSSALHVGGGAFSALIIQDQTSTGLPADISGATERLLIVHEMDTTILSGIATQSGDSTLTISNSGATNFRTVNGQYQPVISMTVFEWQRWRIIWADWLSENLNFQFASGSSCSMFLLAKDGIYISNYPRSVSSLPIPTGGRADIMVRCTTTGTFTITDYSGGTLATVSVTGTGTDTALSAFSPSLPAYLTDLTSTSASSGCSCSTAFARCPSGQNFCVNDQAFDSSIYLHTVAFGSVVERVLSGIGPHPYHHHVYPMQIVGGTTSITDSAEQTYFQNGDWHDVLSMTLSQGGTITVRWSANVHVGTMMLHCHILTHEDQGTMAQELIVNGGTCACNALVTTPSPTPAPGSTPSPSAAPTCSCFSNMATTEVQGKGEVAMEEVQVNDMVLVGSIGDTKQYQSVYAFGHYDPYALNEYYRIHTNSNHSNPLEMSGTHMLYVEGKVDPIRADEIQVGDIVLQTDPESYLVVTEVDLVNRIGAYMPLTKDGFMIVDGVRVSAYVSIADDAPDTVERFASMFSMSEQRLLHWWLAPYRMVCLGISPQLCHDDYNEEGIAKWLVFGRYLARTANDWSYGFQTLGVCFVFLCMLGFVALEKLFFNPVVPLAALCTIIMAHAALSKKSNNEIKKTKVA